MTLCYKCGETEVQEEFQLCSPCEVSHQELAKKLDSRPKVIQKKVKEKLFPIKEMKGGVQVTTWLSREDAYNNGIKLPL